MCCYIKNIFSLTINNKKYLNNINILTEKLKRLENKNDKKVDYIQALTSINITLKLSLDYNKISVAEFKYYLEAVQEINKTYKKLNKDIKS